MIGFIYRNCKSFDNIATLITLYCSLVRSKLEYGSLIWSPIYDKHKNALEQVQRRFPKYLVYKEDSTYPQRGINNNILLTRFYLDSLEKRRNMNSCVFL